MKFNILKILHILSNLLKMSKYLFPESLYLKDDDPIQRYNPSLKTKDNLHKGQLKLFTNELIFLLFHCFEKPSNNKKIVLYIGAGPGDHLIYLTKMFPDIEWHLFDDHFNPTLKSIENIKLFTHYFSEKDISFYKDIAKNKEYDLYLISDIRNLSFNSKNWHYEEEFKIMEDMEVQKNWVVNIKPKYSMLKFRLPFPEKEIIQKIGTSFVYLDGIVYKQPWAKEKSIETRLVVPYDFKFKHWDIQKYEQQMFYHNVTTRRLKYKFSIPELDDFNVMEKLSLKNNFDSVSLIEALYTYFKFIYDETYPMEKIVEKMNFILQTN